MLRLHYKQLQITISITIYGTITTVDLLLWSQMDIVFQVLLNSKLQVDVLGRVWDLSDIDKDGMLDKDEFAVVSKPGKFIFCQETFEEIFVVFWKKSS